MGNDHQSANQHAQSDEPFLSIIEAVVHERDARPRKNQFGVLEPEAVFSEIATILRLIPLVSKSQM